MCQSETLALGGVVNGRLGQPRPQCRGILEARDEERCQDQPGRCQHSVSFLVSCKQRVSAAVKEGGPFEGMD